MSASSLSSPNISGNDHVAAAVIGTLIYFDLFHYPLKLQELVMNCQHVPSSEESIRHATGQLVAEEKIFVKDGLYFLPGREQIVQRRKEGNLLAEQFMKKAKGYSALISSFPFVRCVCISGSLSKGFMDKDSDVDYFIITEPGRLWVCRTFLVLFKKIFLLNSKKYFCVNYFVDENNLSIPDKNIFTATELSSIIPVYNYAMYNRLIMENTWCRDFYPNKKIVRTHENMPYRNGPVKRLTEWLLKGKMGEWLDKRFFAFTVKHWKKKFSSFDESAFDLNLRSRKNVSKHHPQGFQYKVLNDLENNKRMYAERFKVSFPK
ncbi:MAG TPA: nucleotidyltransferase domain-containing protein [Bacteroidia bacterium]|jgi:hypothetical protein